MQYERVIGGNKAHSAHVCGECIHMICIASRRKALIPAPEVSDLELIGVNATVLGILEVYATHPVATLLKVRNEVMSDETARSSDEDSSLRQFSSLILLGPRGHRYRLVLLLRLLP